MSFKTEFVKKAKEYLGEDLEEKIIKSGHEAIIHKYLWSVVSEIGTVKNPTFHQRIGYSNTRIV
ncbi:DUF3942 domain-containing protein, partial [Bacillus thuringiensis]|nr:DUF3942 domain-containing protein [Bacillus thuringiensis]